MKIQYIGEAVLWRDKVNGNTYHSVCVTRCSDGAVCRAKFQYGYGRQYQYSALGAMLAAGWIPAQFGQKAASGCDRLHEWERQNGYPIHWTEQYGTKAECKANGEA